MLLLLKAVNAGERSTVGAEWRSGATSGLGRSAEELNGFADVLSLLASWPSTSTKPSRTYERKSTSVRRRPIESLSSSTRPRRAVCRQSCERIAGRSADLVVRGDNGEVQLTAPIGGFSSGWTGRLAPASVASAVSHDDASALADVWRAAAAILKRLEDGQPPDDTVQIASRPHGPA
jgi:hypothetical protein